MQLQICILVIICLQTSFSTADQLYNVIGDFRPLDCIVEDLRYPFHKTPHKFQELVKKYEGDNSPGRYIIAGSDAGMSNRLRALFAYCAIAHTIYNKAQLLFVWDVNDACPGHFLSVFQPLPNVTFISSMDRENFANHAMAVFNNTRETFDQILYDHEMNFYIKKRYFFDLQLVYYRLLQPTVEVENIVSSFVIDHGLCNMTAVHVRRTDLWDTLSHRIRTAQDAYFRWLDEHTESNSSIFLLTDNPQTQKDFFARYGLPRVLVYANITSEDDFRIATLNESSASHVMPHNELQKRREIGRFLKKRYRFNLAQAGGSGVGQSGALFLTSSAISGSMKGTKSRISTEKRFTGLQHAVVDIFIAAHCWQFRPTTFSSVSDLVKLLSFMHRWHWCDCGVVGC